MDSNIWLQFDDWTRTLSPFFTPKSRASATAIALTRASIAAKVQVFSPQTKPMSSG